jgi:hypothetical protein
VTVTVTITGTVTVTLTGLGSLLGCLSRAVAFRIGGMLYRLAR